MREGPLKVTRRGDEVLIGIDYQCPVSEWPDEAIDRLMADLEKVEHTPEQCYIEELKRDGQAVIDALEAMLAAEKDRSVWLALFAVFGWILAIGGFAALAIRCWP